MILLLTGYTDQKPSLIVRLGHTGLGSIELVRDVLHRSEQQVAKSLEHGRLGGQRADCVGILRKSCPGSGLGKDTGSTVDNVDGLLWQVAGTSLVCVIGVFCLSSPCWWKEPWKSLLTLEVQIYGCSIIAKACRRQRGVGEDKYVNIEWKLSHKNHTMAIYFYDFHSLKNVWIF